MPLVLLAVLVMIYLSELVEALPAYVIVSFIPVSRFRMILTFLHIVCSQAWLKQ